MAKLDVKTFGGVKLMLAGEPLIKLRSGKGQALICYLAVTGRPHNRASLAGLLWSDVPEEDARANLRVLLVKLRQALPEHLIVSRDTVTFNFLAPYTLDVESFLAAFRAERRQPETVRLHSAVELYKGDFLGGFHVTGTDLFDEWVASQREQFKQLAAQALHTLASQAEIRYDHTAGVDYLLRLLLLDPWREEAYRQLMLLLARSGQASAALEQFERCRQTLAAALGTEPAAETAELAQKIEVGEVATFLPEVVRHNLPVPPTELVGRAELLEWVAQKLRDPGSRFVTLTGPGGVGKTRFSVEVAWALLEHFADGVYFIPLAPVSDPVLVTRAVAQAFGLREGGTRTIIDLLTEFLKDRELLLVLDNFEHILPAAAVFAELLARAPNLKVLVTSRTLLHLRAEQSVIVPPLAVPDLGQSSTSLFEKVDSVALFEQRASAVRADFELTASNTHVVGEICARLDGLPLAIELAAARTKLFSPQAILKLLDNRLSLLTRGAVDLPNRHKALRTTIAWSYDLLTTEEKSLFRRLAVTSGGCSLALATALSGAHADEMSILNTLTSLLDKSLLQRVESGSSDPRISMLETIREYAQEKLVEDPREMFEARERHANFYVSLLNQHYLELVHAERVTVRTIRNDLENIRLAWQWATQCVDASMLKVMAMAFGRAFESRPQEAVDMYEQAVERLEANNPDHRAALGYIFSLQAWLLNSLGDPDKAASLADRALELLIPLAEYPGVCRALSAKAWHLWIYRGRNAEAKALWQEALSLARRYNVESAQGEPLAQLVVVEMGLGSFSDVNRLVEKTLPKLRSLGDYMQYTKTLCWSGDNLSRNGHPEQGRDQIVEAVRLAKIHELESFLPIVLCDAAEAELRGGDDVASERYAREGVVIAREKVISYVQGRGLNQLGRVMTRRGKYETARSLLKDSLAIAWKVKDYFGATANLTSHAALAQEQGLHADAACWFTVVVNHERTEKHVQAEAQAALTILEHEMDAPSYVTATSRGRSIGLAAAVEGLINTS